MEQKRINKLINEQQSLLSMQEILYRELNYSDSYEYGRIRLGCLHKFPDHFGTTFDEEFHTTPFRLDNVIKEAVKNSFVLGAFASGHKLIGICGFVAEQRIKAQHRGEIVQLFVDPNYTRQGIGKKLLSLTIRKMFEHSQIEQIIIGVVSANEIAVQLYKKLGFVEYGRLNNYFKSEKGYLTQLFLVLNKSKLKQVI